MKLFINHIKYTKMYLLIALFLGLSCSDKDKDKIVPLPYTEGTVKIAKWKDDKKAAVLLQFDDSTPGQATLGVPAMNKRNIVGTWYVNPGGTSFNANLDSWQNVAPSGGQELANHTLTHTGAGTYSEVVTEVGDASKIIWSIRKQSDFASLIAFNRGGGTSWNEDDLAKVLEEYKNIDRQSYLGITVKALSVPSGSNADKMFEIIPGAINDSIIASIHFHGIAAEDGSPPMDWGNAAVWINNFETFLDKLVAIKDDIWLTGYISVYKYIKEKEKATISIAQYSDEQYSVNLKSEIDTKYYNEPLTVLVYLPQTWTSCLVNYNSAETTYTLQNGLLMFDAIPNTGDIFITKK